MSRYPRALWKPGVTNYGYPRGTHGQLRANNPHRLFCHDAQGWRDGAYATFLDPNRGAAHAIINLDGPPWQFIDFDDAAWHAGGDLPGLGEFANLFCWGLEFEGGYPTPTPITDYQVDTAVELCLWLSHEYAFTWQALRRVDLWEHREVYPTSCPSNRIRWPEIIAGLKGDDMTDAQVRAIVREQTDPIKWQLGKLVAYLQEDQAWEAFKATYPLTPEQAADPAALAEHATKWLAFRARVVDWRT